MGHEVFSVEWNKDFENIDLYEDVNNLTAKRMVIRVMNQHQEGVKQ